MHYTEDAKGKGIFLPWNDLVKGTDEGDCWLRVDGPDIPKNATDQQQSDGQRKTKAFKS